MPYRALEVQGQSQKSLMKQNKSMGNEDLQHFHKAPEGLEPTSVYANRAKTKTQIIIKNNLGILNPSHRKNFNMQKMLTIHPKSLGSMNQSMSSSTQKLDCVPHKMKGHLQVFGLVKPQDQPKPAQADQFNHYQANQTTMYPLPTHHFARHSLLGYNNQSTLIKSSKLQKRSTQRSRGDHKSSVDYSELVADQLSRHEDFFVPGYLHHRERSQCPSTRNTKMSMKSRNEDVIYFA